MPAATASPILSIENLTTEFPGRARPVVIVNDVSLSLHRGETLAVVGESGSGKTMTFLSALGLAPHPGRVSKGRALLDGVDLLALSPEQLRRRRGAEISMVFQDPLTALNPVFTVGDQIAEVLRAHKPVSRNQAQAQAIELLARVHIPDPHRRIDDYPHRFSGGMRQRVLIAMAIALEPKVLIADEPTTALDVTVQAQLLELLAELKTETRMGIVLITHDLGVVAGHADSVAVLYAGRVMEQGVPLYGEISSGTAVPAGCRFHPRCYRARLVAAAAQVPTVEFGAERLPSACTDEEPALAPIGEGHNAACHFGAADETTT